MIEAHIYTTTNGEEFYVRIEEGENGEVLFTSETFTRHEAAAESAARVNTFAGQVPIIDHTE